jgi:hypothetical protein
MSKAETGGMNKIGRLALRREGDNWVAYYAEAETMQQSIFLGSIAIGAVANHLTPTAMSADRRSEKSRHCLPPPTVRGDTPTAWRRACIKVSRVAFCNPKQLQGVIAALVYDAKRHGRRA